MRFRSIISSKVSIPNRLWSFAFEIRCSPTCRMHEVCSHFLFMALIYLSKLETGVKAILMNTTLIVLVIINHIDTPIDEIQLNSANYDLVCNSGGFITFSNESWYLGTITSSDLRHCPDIDRRVNQASRAFGSLDSSVFCNQQHLSPIIRRHLFMAIIMNLLLWDCETWALLSEDRN